MGQNLKTAWPEWPEQNMNNGMSLGNPGIGPNLVRATDDPLALTQGACDPAGQTAERAARRHAIKQLHKAIVPFLPVERRCIIARLCYGMSFDRIGQNLGLTRADVRDILSHARKWVGMHTAYFTGKWYWKDSDPRPAGAY